MISEEQLKKLSDKELLSLLDAVSEEVKIRNGLPSGLNKEQVEKSVMEFIAAISKVKL